VKKARKSYAVDTKDADAVRARRSLEFPLVVRHRLNAVGKVVDLRLQRVELPHDFKNRGRRLDRNVLLRCPTLSNGVARVS
jgi:hypothetical protein